MGIDWSNASQWLLWPLAWVPLSSSGTHYAAEQRDCRRRSIEPVSSEPNLSGLQPPQTGMPNRRQMVPSINPARTENRPRAGIAGNVAAAEQKQAGQVHGNQTDSALRQSSVSENLSFCDEARLFRSIKPLGDRTMTMQAFLHAAVLTQ